MTDDELTPQRVAAMTAAVDIEASPRAASPSPWSCSARTRPHPRRSPPSGTTGEAPLVIATGGVNRHTGIIEGREFARQLRQSRGARRAIRIEDQSEDTWQNVEFSMPYLREALSMGLRLAVVSKWYHLRPSWPAHPAARSRTVARHRLGTGLRRDTGHPGELAKDPRRPPPGNPGMAGSSPPRRRGNLRAARKADGAWQLP